MKKPIFIGFLMSLLFCSSASALLETRVSFGILGANPNLDSLCPACVADTPSTTPTYGLGADAILTLPYWQPYLPGVGLRYENMSSTARSSGRDDKMDFTRTSLLFNWRPIDGMYFLGPLFTYGLSHSTRLKAEEGGATKASFSSDSVTSYSVGIEGGVKLTGFVLGAELGYLDMRWNDANDDTANATTQDINMSGTYAKILLGFSI